MMDSNNFPSNVGVGEREARIACPLVERRHYRMAHGVGRSGDISAVQPKVRVSDAIPHLTAAIHVTHMHDTSQVPQETGASICVLQAAGSSLLAKLANLLAADALRIAGMSDLTAATVLPLATGMALTSTLLAIKRTRPSSIQYVLWPR